MVFFTNYTKDTYFLAAQSPFPAPSLLTEKATLSRTRNWALPTTADCSVDLLPTVRQINSLSQQVRIQTVITKIITYGGCRPAELNTQRLTLYNDKKAEKTIQQNKTNKGVQATTEKERENRPLKIFSSQEAWLYFLYLIESTIFGTGINVLKTSFKKKKKKGINMDIYIHTE